MNSSIHKPEVHQQRFGNTDLIAKQLVRALKLIERQHMLVIDQRVQASTYQQEIIKLQSNFIDVQTKEMQQFRMELYSKILLKLSRKLLNQASSLTVT